MVLLSDEIYQKLITNQITKAEAAKSIKRLLRNTGLPREQRDTSDVKRKIHKIAKEFAMDAECAKKYKSQGVIDADAKVLGLLEALLGFSFEEVSPEDFYWDKNIQNYSLNEEGHIIKLAIGGCEGPKLRFFPEEICLLKSLDTLYLEENGLCELPECIGELQSLRELILRYNEIRELPQSIRELSHLEVLDLQDERYLFYLYNILDYVDFDEIEGEISVEKLDGAMAEKLKMLEDSKQTPWNFDDKSRIYPPKEILESKDYEHIILWMLYNNKVCTWSEFKEGPFNIVDLTEYSGTMRNKRFIERQKYIDDYFYRITPFGIIRLRKIENKLDKY